MVRICLVASDTRSQAAGQRKTQSRVEMLSGAGAGAGANVSAEPVAGVVRVLETLSFSRR